MPMWSPQILRTVDSTDDLHVAPYREDGETPGTLIWVWSVVVHHSIFVRSANPDSRWFAAALRERAGIVRAADYEGPVTFTPVTDEALKDKVDGAFVEKYTDAPYFSPDILTKSRERIAQIDPA